MQGMLSIPIGLNIARIELIDHAVGAARVRAAPTAPYLRICQHGICGPVSRRVPARSLNFEIGAFAAGTHGLFLPASGHLSALSVSPLSVISTDSVFSMIKWKSMRMKLEGAI